MQHAVECLTDLVPPTRRDGATSGEVLPSRSGRPRLQPGHVSEPSHFSRQVYDMLLARGPMSRNQLRR